MQNKDQARLEKNARIAASRAATALRRKNMVCRTYTLKIVKNKISRKSRESLRLAFLEAKWLRNAALASDWRTYDYKPNEVSVKTPAGYEVRQIKNLGSQLKQSVLQQIATDISNLGKAKKKGMKVGALKFTKKVSSINLKQFGATHRFRGNRVKVRGIHGWLRVRGVEQLADKEIANAKLLSKPDGYYLAVTTYENKTIERKSYKTESIGIDFGVKTGMTLSDGREFNIFVQETERLKRLQRKLSRQQKGSKNRMKTIAAIQREYQKMTNMKNELANQFVAMVTGEAETVYFQDDNFNSWKRKNSPARGGRRIQHGILGRVKSKLSAHPRAVKVERYIATTATCPCCGTKTHHGLGEEWFVCAECFYKAPRDVHAANNMILFGRNTPTERGEAPVEQVSSAQSPDSASHFAAKQETARLSQCPEAALALAMP